MIGIIHSNLGNNESVKNMILQIRPDVALSSDQDILSRCKCLILPGVGSFDCGMNSLMDMNLDRFIIDQAKKNIVILGICLGMQMLTNSSEEGSIKGLNLVDAETLKFSYNSQEKKTYKVPHMGWNYVEAQKPFFQDFGIKQRFYFVHSFYVKCNDKSDILTTTSYGIDFASSFLNNNIVGVQFHPEKSHNFGISFFKSFFSYYKI